MPYETDSAGRSRLTQSLDPGEFDRIDRILLGACAAIWLVALGAGVAATVALVDLGRGHPEPMGDAETPWLLYTVIGVSALVIIGAVPLLLRARRAALDETPPPPARPAPRPAPGQPQPPVRGVEAPTEKLRVAPTSAGRVNPGPGYAPPLTRGTSAVTPTEMAVEQLWLRYAVVIAGAIGIATVAIGVGTYLMAIDSNAVAWVFYGLVGLVTLAMPAVPWYFLRELRALLENPAA